MIFMGKEGIHITFPRLARYIHTGEQLDIILKIVKFRGGYLISSQKQSLVVLMYCVIECSCSATDAVYNTFLILHFPLSSADLTASTTFSDMICLVSSEYRSVPVSANGFPSSSITSVTLLT